MLTVKETVKEPCCEKCGQSLPTPPPLTTSGKIDRLRELVNNASISSILRSAMDVLIDILADLEKRPTYSLTTAPPIQTWPPYAPNTVPMPYQTEPDRPYIGDPLPGQGGTFTCRNQSTAERTVTPFAINATSQADGFGGE